MVPLDLDGLLPESREVPRNLDDFETGVAKRWENLPKFFQIRAAIRRIAQSNFVLLILASSSTSTTVIDFNIRLLVVVLASTRSSSGTEILIPQYTCIGVTCNSSRTCLTVVQNFESHPRKETPLIWSNQPPFSCNPRYPGTRIPGVIIPGSRVHGYTGTR
eukprot:640422-Rhodomonas_salina.1